MHAETLDAVYGALSEALGRIGERDASLFLATLVLDLVAHHDDAAFASAAIARAERLTRGEDSSHQAR